MKLWIKVDDLRNVDGIEFRLSSNRISDFAQAMQLIAGEKVRVSPVSEVWDAGWRTPSLPAAWR